MVLIKQIFFSNVTNSSDFESYLKDVDNQNEEPSGVSLSCNFFMLHMMLTSILIMYWGVDKNEADFMIMFSGYSTIEGTQTLRLCIQGGD